MKFTTEQARAEGATSDNAMLLLYGHFFFPLLSIRRYSSIVLEYVARQNR